MTDWNILDSGAVGDGVTNNAAAIQKTIDACAAHGGGRVVVPSGKTFCTGPFTLVSNIELHIENGATIVAIADASAYPERAVHGKKWISADDADSIAVTGRGAIDGRGVEFMAEELPHAYRAAVRRPYVFYFENCSHVAFHEITLRDSPFWAIHLAGCEDVLIHGIRILNNRKIPNCDGIDPDCCRNVRISDCHIEAGDDCICLKSEVETAEKYGACENITVTGCTLVSTSCALKIGTGTNTDVRNVVFNSCTITDANRGIGIFLRDGGTVENVICSNMTIQTRLFHPFWWGASEPIYVTAFNRTHGSALGRIKNIRFANMICEAENGIYVAGCEASRPGGIAFDNVSIELSKWTKYRGGRYDHRPCAADNEIERHASGFCIRCARDVTVRNSVVTWGQNPPEYYRHALEADDVPGLSIENLRGRSAFPDKYEPIHTS